MQPIASSAAGEFTPEVQQITRRRSHVKKIGLIGGMSWESTTLYYQIMNREVARRLGGLSSAPIGMVSLDFKDITDRQKAGDWSGMADTLCQAARSLEHGGAECMLIGTNTMHRVAEQVQNAIRVPLLHIADVTADAILARGFTCIGLLGTRFTMEQTFYVDRLAARGIQCVIPDQTQRDEVHRIIFEELCQGHFRDESRESLLKIVESLRERGAQGAVLGCTELPLLLSAEQCPLPLFDTTRLHALAAVEFCLADHAGLDLAANCSPTGGAARTRPDPATV
jgi:aspartate racemase